MITSRAVSTITEVQEVSGSYGARQDEIEQWLPIIREHWLIGIGFLHHDSAMGQELEVMHSLQGTGNYDVGWVVGAGIEGAFGGGWSVRLEYLYLDLGDISGQFTTAVLGPSGTAFLSQGFSSRVTDNIVRVGVNYKFSGPDIARY